jgi:hypothetical protein
VNNEFHVLAALPVGQKPLTYFIAGYLGPSAGLDTVRNRNMQRLDCIGIQILQFYNW